MMMMMTMKNKGHPKRAIAGSKYGYCSNMTCLPAFYKFDINLIGMFMFTFHS